MKQSFWDKRIPTLLGIFIIVLGIGATTYLTNKNTPLNSNASPPLEPQDVRITNISDNSFTVSYITQEAEIGSINYGTGVSLGQSGLDTRDKQNGNLNPYTVHNITVNNLSPETGYFFDITSGQQAYNNAGQLFSVSTGPVLSTASATENKLTGKIVLPNGNPPKEAILYLTADNSQVISTLVNSEGNYTFLLNNLRTNDLSSYYNLNQNSTIKMLITADSLTSNVLLSFGQNSLVPTITLSKNYDFRVSQYPVASQSANFQTFPSFESTASAKILNEKGPQILTPENNQGFTDQKPMFKGTGLPDQTVQITIHSNQPLQATVTTDQNGNWNYVPSTPLSPGTHTITITTLDPSGILRTITQSFVVYAQGQQINPAVPSGTPTPTPEIISQLLTPTSTPIPTLTPTPTEILIIPIATPASQLKVLPPTGNPFIITAGIVGVIISLLGGLLFLLTLTGA